MAKIKFITALATAILFNCVCQTLQAQTTDEQLTQTILHLDSMFWKSYNDCNTIESGKYFTNDVEFYHSRIIYAVMKMYGCAGKRFREQFTCIR